MAMIFRRQTTVVFFFDRKNMWDINHISTICVCVCLNIGYIPNMYQPFNEENSDKPFGHFGDPIFTPTHLVRFDSAFHRQLV